MPPSDEELERLTELVKKQAAEIEQLCRELVRVEKLVESNKPQSEKQKSDSHAGTGS